MRFAAAFGRGAKACPNVDPVVGQRNTRVYFDGHLSNERQIADALEAHGAHTTGVTAADLIRQSFEVFGEPALTRLEGHFALVVITKSAAFLVRDAFGTKPLHYYRSPDHRSLIFGSTAGDVISQMDGAPSLDAGSLTDFEIFGRVLGGRCLLKGVRSVPPASMIRVTDADGALHVDQMSVPSRQAAPVAGGESAVEGVIDRLDASVATCMTGHAPAGIALSGGLDSSVVALLARERSALPLRTFTMIGDSNGADVESARHLSEELGSTHSELRLTFDEYVRNIPAFIRAREFPTVAGITLFLLSQHAAHGCRMCLTGFGAGDVIGDAYEQFNWHIFRSRLRQRLRRAAALGIQVSDEAMIAFEAAMTAGTYADYFESPGYVDAGVDWIERCGSAVGLELCMPYCSVQLYEFVRAVPSDIRYGPSPGREKHLLKAAALARFGEAVRAVVDRPKGALPDATVLFQRRFATMCQEMDDELVGRSEFRARTNDKQLLVLLHVFTLLFQEGLDPEEIDMFALLGAAAA